MRARPLTAAREDVPESEVVDFAVELLRAAEHCPERDAGTILSGPWLGWQSGSDLAPAPLRKADPGAPAPSAHAALRAPAGAGGVVVARVRALMQRMAAAPRDEPPPWGARVVTKRTCKLVAQAGGGDIGMTWGAYKWAVRSGETVPPQQGAVGVAGDNEEWEESDAVVG
ncbi:hypothetical protein MNEG_12051 [Monoraphidium neglectum]|uniref:Uncharacterized protein n=1 Tax=Monoraphidium neglectum TaxID=145388 RepID=A0A0D2LWQ4_9CHLO|nr:hypothetical protein MNEG_12051 [Monoraphidium neglectum]KIY95909.1 hypothetical protein MNEG_12051 [Monoraphidium neglectum]|eukprot:XP_013894929.1 hypothetical protein MNEG_12051 [Monoraphidium neglectum]